MKINIARLEIALANACLTTGELSKKTNLNYSTISRIKSGMQAHPATVGKIAKALNVNVEELIEDTAATVNQSNDMFKNVLEDHAPDCVLQVWLQADCENMPCVAFQFSSGTITVRITEGYQVHRCNEYLRSVVQSMDLAMDISFITYTQYSELLDTISSIILERMCAVCK